jgi:hypothetical protein
MANWGTAPSQTIPPLFKRATEKYGYLPGAKGRRGSREFMI